MAAVTAPHDMAEGVTFIITIGRNRALDAHIGSRAPTVHLSAHQRLARMAGIEWESIVFAGSIKGDFTVEYRSRSINQALHGFVDARGVLTPAGTDRVLKLLRNAHLHPGIPGHLMCWKPKRFGGRGEHGKVLIYGLCGDCVADMEREAGDRQVLDAFQ